MPAQVTNYQCPGCTGPLHFVGASGKLECEYCGASYDVAEIEALYAEKEEKAAAAQQAAEEKAAKKKEASAAGGDWDTSGFSDDWGEEGAHMKAYSCPSCGAELICDESTAATSCPYCGNPTVVPGQFSGELKPDFILPFKLSREDAIKALKEHYAGKIFLPKSFTNYHEASTVYKTDAKKAKKLIEESGITPGAITLRTTDNEQIKGMAAQVKNDLDALGFDVTIQTDTSPATYAAIDGGEAYDILLAPGDPSCFGADPDLLLNWWYGDNVWMQTRCPWKESAEWQKLHGLMDEALAAEGDEQQKKWNECFDIIADNAVLYPVVHVKTVSASWDDPSTAPNGEALDGFKGIGTTSMSFRGVATVKA